ncbi:MAG: vanadium-dependent haloperoxidase [Pseudomonadota bacterium]
MDRSRRAFLAGLAATTALGLSGCAARFGHQQSYATQAVHWQNMNTVFHWTDVALQAIRDQGMAPPLATRALSMSHVAGFLAVNGIQKRYHTPFTLGDGPPEADPDIAYGMAFCTALGEHFQQTFLGDRKAFLKRFPNRAHKQRSVDWGDLAGKYVVRLRTNDGAEPSKVNYALKRYLKREDSLAWTPTLPHYDAGEGPYFNPSYDNPLVPGFGAVTPWAFKSLDAYRAPNFYDPRSPEFAEEFAQIKVIGAAHSPTRTHDQSQIALFWEDGPWGISPPGHFALIAMQILQHRRMDIYELSRSMALISMAMCNAGISTWDSKYHHDIIRPETAIRHRAHKFHNPDPRVVADPKWKSFIPTPPFPTYTSGHSAFGASGLRMLANIVGRDDIAFSARAPDTVIWPKTLSGVTRHWPSLWAAAEENGLSRIYGGVHWNIDNDVALRAGRDIADRMFAETLPVAA